MNETYVMLPAAGSLTDFFAAISKLASEYQTQGNFVLIGIALLILGSKFLIGDDETKARGRKQVPYIIIGAAIIMAVSIGFALGIAAGANVITRITFSKQTEQKVLYIFGVIGMVIGTLCSLWFVVKLFWK